MIRPIYRKRLARRQRRNNAIQRTIWHRIVFGCVAVLLGVSFLGIDAPRGRAQGGSAYDLIAAVNQLRTSNGLAPYQINAALMASAQAHSDYQASIGSITHTGSGGTRPKDRAVAAGYGGGATVSVSENIAGGMSMSYQGAVQMWQGDSLHLNTMLGADYVDVGAGVATSGSTTYFTLDVGYVAGSSGSGSSGSAASSGATNLSVAPTEAAFFPVVVATPRPDGSVVHEVQAGQSLWSIAATYGIALPDLLALNGFTNNTFIFPGDKILIKAPSEIAPSPAVSETLELETHPVVAAIDSVFRTPSPTARDAVEVVDRIDVEASTPTPGQASTSSSSTDPLLWVIGALVFGGIGLIILGNVLKRSG
jgi:LysM repeat protein